MNKLSRKLRRVLFLIPYVARHRGGVPLSDLATILGTPARDVEREIHELLTVGVPGGSPGDFVDLWMDGRGASARVFAVPSRVLRRPPRLTQQEAFALLLGASAMKKTGVGSFDDALSRAETKIRALVQRRPDGGDVNLDKGGIVIERAGHERPNILGQLTQASKNRHPVELDYSSVAAQRRKKFVVEPYGILNHSAGWYVLGRNITSGKDHIFLFKVERVLGVKVLGGTFKVPTGFDLRKFGGERLWVAGSKPVEVTLRLKGSAAKNISGQFPRAKKERGGVVVVKFKEHTTGWLAAWVLRLGAEVEVVAPVELGRQVAGMAKRVGAG